MAIRIFKLILIGFATAFCQTVLVTLTSISGIAPDFATIIILMVILRRDMYEVYAAAFVVGLVTDVLSPELLGIGTAIRYGLAVAAFEVKQHLNMDQLLSRLYLMIGTELVFQLFYQLNANSFNLDVLGHIYWQTSLPTFLYTAIIGVVAMKLSDFKYSVVMTRRSFD